MGKIESQNLSILISMSFYSSFLNTGYPHIIQYNSVLSYLCPVDSRCHFNIVCPTCWQLLLSFIPMYGLQYTIAFVYCSDTFSCFFRYPPKFFSLVFSLHTYLFSTLFVFVCSFFATSCAAFFNNVVTFSAKISSLKLFYFCLNFCMFCLNCCRLFLRFCAFVYLIVCGSISRNNFVFWLLLVSGRQKI